MHINFSQDKTLLSAMPAVFGLINSLAQIFLPCWFGNMIIEHVRFKLHISITFNQCLYYQLRVSEYPKKSSKVTFSHLKIIWKKIWFWWFRCHREPKQLEHGSSLHWSCQDLLRWEKYSAKSSFRIFPFADCSHSLFIFNFGS